MTVFVTSSKRELRLSNMYTSHFFTQPGYWLFGSTFRSSAADPFLFVPSHQCNNRHPDRYAIRCLAEIGRAFILIDFPGNFIQSREGVHDRDAVFGFPEKFIIDHID